jgi:O-antigen ligase
MTKKSNYNIESKKIPLIFTIIFTIIFAVSQLSLALNSISLYVLVPCVLFYSIYQSPHLIWRYKPLLYFLFLIILSVISCVKSKHMDDSLNELRTLSGSFALCFIITQFCIKNRAYIYLFYKIYILLFFILIFRAYNEGLLYNISERFSGDNLNANLFGYVGFNAVVSSFFLWQFVKSPNFTTKNKNNFNAFIFITTVILALVANIFAATRAGTGIILFVVILFIIIKSLVPFSIKTLIYIPLFFLSGVLLFVYGWGALDGSNLQERIFTESIEDDVRTKLLMEAYQVGVDNLILGVGPANFLYYSYYEGFSHSTFFEIFANNGVFALALFLAMLLSFFKNLVAIKTSNANQKKIKLYFLVFISFFVMYQFFYVFHTSPFLISFYYLVLIHSYLFLRDGEMITFPDVKVKKTPLILDQSLI